MSKVVGNASAALADLKADLREASARNDDHRVRQLEDKIALLKLQDGGFGKTETPRRKKGEA